MTSHSKITIVKVGGAVVEHPDSLNALLDRFAHIEGAKILVHGGGRLATDMATKLAIPTQMVEGRRITDAEMLDVVIMVYAGLINKSIVAQLQARQVNALGVCGADLRLIEAEKRPVKQIDYGWVGDVKRCHVDTILPLLRNDVCLVVAPISCDPATGQLLNTNADTIAAALAQALAAASCEVTLLYCFEKKGVLRDVSDDNSLIPQLDLQTYQSLKASQNIHSGMIPKLDNAFETLAQGVQAVWIMQADNLGQQLPIGTRLVIAS
ncbi:MAG TPA: acetylglutamate kinase [Microscillaceae bacterium]|nr:acetylglutamate kinase [Microscillaceae bacterium]